jgi:hypothetical protein
LVSHLLPLFPRKTKSAHFLLLEDFVDISFLSYPHVLLVVNIACHVALYISLKIVGHGYSRPEWKKLINMSGKMLKVPCTDRRIIISFGKSSFATVSS